MSSMGIFSAGIGGHIETRNAQDTGSIDEVNQGIEHISRILNSLAWLNGLIPHGVDALIHAITMTQGLDLLNGVALAKVNRDGADTLHLVKAILYLIHDIDFTGPTHHATVRSHSSARTGPKHTTH